MSERIPLPKLDDRTFDDLLNEARQRAARFIPEWEQGWTDYNPSDPGSTLLDLFAWFTEQMLFRFNQVPELHRLKMIELMGLHPAASRPARAALRFTPVVGVKSAVIAAGTKVVGPSVEGSGPLVFETLHELELVPHRMASVRVFDGQRYLDHTTDNDELRGSFQPLARTEEKCALFLGFDRAMGAEDSPRFPSRLRLSVTALPALHGPSAGPQSGALSGVEVKWSCFTAGDPSSSTSWRELRVVEDQSNGFAESGEILLDGIRNDGEHAISLSRWAEDSKPRFWIKCQVSKRSDSMLLVPRIARVESNMVFGEQRLTVRDERLGFGTGTPAQRVNLRNRNVVPSSLQITTRLKGEERKWTQVAHLVGQARDALVYELDERTGTIQFGSRYGAHPRPEEEIIAQVYQVGGGAVGNVPPESINALLRPIRGVAKVSNPAAGFGGRDREATEELVARAPIELGRRSRAVTADDFASFVAERVDGVAKVVALPSMHPECPGVDAPGCITVVILPEWDLDRDTREPAPTRAQVEMARVELDRHRLVGTELHVTGPSFVRVSIRGRIQVSHDYSTSSVQERCHNWARSFVEPTRRIDQATAGKWQFARALRPELLRAQLLQSDGVLDVEGFAVVIDGRELDSSREFQLGGHVLPLLGSLGELVAERSEYRGPSR